MAVAPPIERPHAPRAARIARLAPAAPFLAALATAALVLVAAPGVAPSKAFALCAWIGFAPLAAVLSDTRPARAALLGWLAGFAFHAGACAWFPGLVARFSATSPVLAVLASVAVWSFAGLSWAAFALIVRALGRSRWMPWCAAASFVVIERWFPQPFPYSLGLTQYRFLYVAQAAELGGPYVLTFLMVLVGCTLAQLLRRAGTLGRARALARPVALPAALVLAAIAFGAARVASVRAGRDAAPSMRLAIVQASHVRTGWHGAPDGPEILGRYQALSTEIERAAAPIDLIVWPEKAYPLLLRRDAQHDYAEGNPRRIRRGFEAPLLFGVQAVDVATHELTNAAALLDRRERRELSERARVVYEKVRLIPYSERLPGALATLSPRSQRYVPGRSFEPVTLADGTRLGVFICFESSFPEHVRALVARGPSLLVNLSDDAWFGDGAEPEQHLSQVVFRAIESRRDLVRATGSGISAHIAATGETLIASGVRREGAGDRDAALVIEPKLLAIDGIYAHLGDLFSIGCACACAGMALAAGAARSRRRPLDSLPRP